MIQPAPNRIAVERSSAALDQHSSVKRLPRWPNRRRADDFYRSFDSLQLFYDVFWHADGQRILGIGPAPRNLRKRLQTSRAVAQPSGKKLTLRLHVSLSTMIAEWRGAPPDTTSLELEVAGQNFALKVQPNLSAAFSGRRMLFTMNKNNDLAWIREWARWHVHFHGTDAIVLFDNGSDRYEAREIEAILEGIEGIKTYSVVPFPHKFGPIDGAVKVDPYWARFAQISSMGLVLRRFGAHAQGLLNCDIDELAHASGNRSLYDVVRETPKGLLILPGRWVEANRDEESTGETTHRAFSHVHADEEIRNSSPVKWILDPQRDWVRRLSVHPYWHWMQGRPPFSKSRIDDAFFWHFRGINTGWKLKDRAKNRVPMSALCRDEQLVDSFLSLRACGPAT